MKKKSLMFALPTIMVALVVGLLMVGCGGGGLGRWETAHNVGTGSASITSATFVTLSVPRPATLAELELGMGGVNGILSDTGVSNRLDLVSGVNLLPDGTKDARFLHGEDGILPQIRQGRLILVDAPESAVPVDADQVWVVSVDYIQNHYVEVRHNRMNRVEVRHVVAEVIYSGSTIVEVNLVPVFMSMRVGECAGNYVRNYIESILTNKQVGNVSITPFIPTELMDRLPDFVA